MAAGMQGKWGREQYLTAAAGVTTVKLKKVTEVFFSIFFPSGLSKIVLQLWD